MMKLFYSLLLLLLSVSPVRAMEYVNGEPQGGGAAIGSYEDVVGLWTDCGSLFMKGDGTCGASSIVEGDPLFSAWDRSTGISITTGQITDITTYLTYTDITALWTDCVAGVLMADGTCVVLGSAASSATTDFDPAGAAAAVIAAAVTESDTTHCPDGASVFTALAGKQASGSYLTSETDPVIDALFDAYTMLYADTDNTPVALAFTTYSLGGRLDAGFVNIPIDSTAECLADNVCGGGHGHAVADLTDTEVTAAELTATADGSTAATATTLADTDNMVVNDGGTMVQVALTNLITYLASKLDTLLDVFTISPSSGTADLSNVTVTLAACPPAVKSANYTVGTDNACECYGGEIFVTSAATITGCPTGPDVEYTIHTVGATAVVFNPNATGTEDTPYLDGTALAQGANITNTSTTGDLLHVTHYAADTVWCNSGSPDGDHWTGP